MIVNCQDFGTAIESQTAFRVRRDCARWLPWSKINQQVILADALENLSSQRIQK